MFKARNKKFSLLMALIFAFTVIFPVGAAFAADYSRIGSVSVVDDDGDRTLNTVKVVTTGGELSNGDTVIIRLPKDFAFNGADGKPLSSWEYGTVSKDVYYGDYDKGCYIYIPNDSDNGLNGAGVEDGTDIFDIEVLDDNEIKIEVTGNPSVIEDGQFFIYLKNVHVDEGFDGDIELTMDAPPGSGFDDAKVVVGCVSGGNVEIEVTDTDTFSDSGYVTIRLTEDRAGAFDKDSESVKFILPDGFVWDEAIDGKNIEKTKPSDENSYAWVVYGSGLEGTIEVDEDELIVNITDDTGNAGDKATCIEIVAKIEVDDETEVELGDIIVDVKGESDVTPSEVVVGTYGEYEVKVTAADPETVYAGQLEQEIADITIEELIEGSLVDGRTITLTLPSWAKWGALPDEVSDGSVTLELTSFPGKDGQVAKYVVHNEDADDAAELELEDMEVVLSPEAEVGDLVVEIGGTAGINEEVKVAEVVAPLEVTVSGVPNIVIGRSAQDIGEITITEADAGMLKEGKDLVLKLPDDIDWDDYDVEVVEGDLELGDIDDDDNVLTIEIEDESNDPSTIKITGSVVAYRTVPEGDVFVKVKGEAVIEVNDVSHSSGEGYTGEVIDYYGDPVEGYYEISDVPAIEYDEDGLFEDDTTVAKAKVATVGTPAPAEQKLTTSITLGENGSYISDGRIMVQLRDAATALGVAEQNIFWDNNTKSVTFIKGDRVVQITVGDPLVKLNGIALPTDKGAEIKDGRTYVSLRAAGVAFGATATWDNATKTATLTVQ
ncbi:MAG: copper amine oxidase N-terminal domain-containing protein [Peptococcaceae bacterium]|nr:copper amine oxidase N-terminal domain-containing protein [Peptococcaceae bacterium]